jgi:hypothetical protein
MKQTEFLQHLQQFDIAFKLMKEAVQKLLDLKDEVQTNVPPIFLEGDLAEVLQRLLQRKTELEEYVGTL